MSISMLADARAEALFASDIQPSDTPPVALVRNAVRDSVRTHHVAGCAALVAYEFGEHPETAAARMRWARETVAASYPRRTSAEIVWSRRRLVVAA